MDVDNYPSWGVYQCVDVADDYCIALWGNYANTIGTGNAGWPLFNATKPGYFTKILNDTSNPNLIPKHGDIVFWSYGHVAVVDTADVNGMMVFEQNYGTPDGTLPCARRHQTYPSVIGWLRPILSTTRYNPVAPGDAGFAKHGAASGWTSFAGGVYGTAIYSYVGNTVRDNWARWTFDLSKLKGAGGYKVEAYVTSTHAGTTKAHYHINTSSGLKYATVNQRVLSNAWANLGTYTLAAGSAWVELDDVTGEPYGTTANQQIVFDAIRLTYSNRAPVAASNSYTTAQDTALTVAAKGVLANDSDIDGNALTARLVTSVAHGTLSLSSNGGFTYTPAAGFSGADSFTYCANDGTANSNTVAVSLTVTPSATPAPTPTPTPKATAKLTIRLSGLKSGAMRLGRRVAAKGTLTPTNLVASKVKLTVQRKKSGKWTTVKSVTRTVSASSAYAWRYKPARRGTYRLRTTIAKTAAHTAARTAWRGFRVK